MEFTTAGLCDEHEHSGRIQIAEPIFRQFGAKTAFSGRITTLKLFEDHGLIKQVVSEPGEGRVLVVDAGGSHRCALVGENLAETALANHWEGLVIYGCVRNTERLRSLPIAIFALHSHPLRSASKGQGDRDILITFANIQFKKNHYLFADADGLLVSEVDLCARN